MDAAVDQSTIQYEKRKPKFVSTRLCDFHMADTTAVVGHADGVFVYIVS